MHLPITVCLRNALPALLGLAFFTTACTAQTPIREVKLGDKKVVLLLDSTAAGNATLLAAINATVASTTGTISSGGAFPTFIQRIIAGSEASAGVFVPKLGGVDRSTVAIISTSLVAGAGRPKVVYFGASDGMLHAVCGSEVANTGCPVGAPTVV